MRRQGGKGKHSVIPKKHQQKKKGRVKNLPLWGRNLEGDIVGRARKKKPTYQHQRTQTHWNKKNGQLRIQYWKRDRGQSLKKRGTAR